MPAFSGSLNTNYIFAALYNMIISQQVFASPLRKHQTLVDQARVDGGLYGDTKLYVSTDVLKSKPWGADSEASNLLALDRPPAPKTQAIELDQFRQIRVTIDEYLSKQAWMGEGVFSQFNGVITSWIGDTKSVYDGTLYNVFIGTDESSTGKQQQQIDVTTPTTGLTGLEASRVEALTIAKGLADLIDQIEDYSRDFNDNQFLRSFGLEDLKIIWNKKYINQIRKVDLPTIFHKDGLIEKMNGESLAPRYWGVLLTSSTIGTYSASTPAAGKPIDSDDGSYVPGTNHANGMVRSAVEKDVTVSAVAYHVFPGDEIPAGATVKASGTFELGEVYIQTDDIICKIYVELPPYMSAMTVGTSFFNPRSLTENKYLTFGHNSLEHLFEYPVVTVRKV